MPSLIEAMKAAAFEVVEVDGIEYRLEAFSSRDLLRLEGQFLLGIDPTAREESLKRLSPEQAASKAQVVELVVAASLRAVRAAGDPEEGWEPVEVVMKASEEAMPAEREGASRLFVGRLEPATLRALSGRAWALSGGGGRAASAVATFRGEPSGGGARGHHRKKAGKVGPRGAGAGHRGDQP